MADEIKNANVIRVFKDGTKWIAMIGPDPQLGRLGTGDTWGVALLHLAYTLIIHGWPFDESWRPGKTTYHDA